MSSRPTLNVALVVPGFPVTRAEPGMAAIVDLVERVAQVHRVTVVALHHPRRGRAYRLGSARVVPLGLPADAGVAGRARVLARGVAEVSRRDRRGRIDVVHELWADEPGAVAVLSAPLVRARTVVSVLGGELVALPDIGYGAGVGRGGRWTTRLALRRADALTVGSQKLAELVQQRRPRVHAEVCPLGVDLEEFAPGRRTRAASQIVLFVGSLEPVKDPLVALRVFSRIAHVRPHLRLVLCGAGSLRRQVEQLALDLNLADRVELRGQVARDEMPGLYRRAASLLVTSRHEGQHVAAIEAAACGLPVVGFAVGALPELDGGAHVVERRDEAELAAALARVVDDETVARRLGRAGRAAAMARYDVRLTTERFLEIYARLARRA